MGNLDNYQLIHRNPIYHDRQEDTVKEVMEASLSIGTTVIQAALAKSGSLGRQFPIGA